MILKHTRKTVHPAETFLRREPENLRVENASHFNGILRYQCPRLDIYFFPEVCFLPDATLFFGIWPLALSFLFFRKRIRTHNAKGIWTIRSRWQKRVLEKTGKPYLIIHDAWTTNYYHWTTQALPRLLLTLKVNSNFTLLLPANHDKVFHRRSLELLGVTDIKSLGVGECYYKVSGLLYPAHDIEIGSYHDDLMKDLAKCFRQQKSAKPVRLFARRTSTAGRIIENEDEVLRTFVSFGFQIVSFENLTLDEQVNLAGQAVVLAAVHGAALTNMLFMSTGSSVLELTTRLQGDQYYYFTLSNAMRHRYFYLFCESDNALKTIQEADLKVDVLALRDTLQAMLGQKA